MSNIANNILSAVDIIVDKKLQEAQFDKTVIASVIKLIDPINLKYQVRYQDSILEARVGDGTLYENGDAVFLLLPQNDLESSNWILGLASSVTVSQNKNNSIKLNYTVQGKNVVSVIEGNEYINAMVNNRIVLWKQTNKDEDNLIKIDADAFSSYAKIGDSFLLSAEFQSVITTNGNYGLEVIIKYNELVNQKYVLDTSNMVGNYYNFTTFKRQIEAFPLYSEQAEIVEIALFTEGITENDTITVQNISLQVAQQNEYVVGSDIVLNIVTPSGTTFYTDTDSEEQGLLIEAHLEKKGARIFDRVEYYWFIQNPLINAGQPLYNAYGGAGWEIINNSNIDPYKESYSVSFTEVPSNSRKFKVVVVYDGVAYAQEVTFFNTTSKKITITMSRIDKTISCDTSTENNYIYQWYKEDLLGNLEIIENANEDKYIVTDLDGSTYACAVFITNNNSETVFLGMGSIQLLGESTLIDVITEYALGDSSENPPDDDASWSTTMPTAEVGKSLWQRVTTFYESGTKKQSYVCLTSSPSFLIELSNDGATISADSEGNINQEALQELTKTTVIVWYGDDDITEKCDFEWTVKPDNKNENNESLNKLNTETESTVYFTAIDPASDTVQAIVSVIYQPDKGNEMALGSKTFTISKVKGGEKGDSVIDYKLIVSPNAINRSKETGDVEIKLTPKQLIGSEISDLTLDGENAYITVTGEENKITGSSYKITSDNDISTITFDLIVNSVIRDSETIKIVNDGEPGGKGDPGTSPYLIELSNDNATISIGTNGTLSEDILELLTETTISVYQGDKDITVDCDFDWIVSEGDEISANNKKTTTIHFTKITGENAFVTAIVKKDDVEIGQKTFSVAVVEDGAEGAPAINYKLQVSPSGVINWSDITEDQAVATQFTILKITGDTVETINVGDNISITAKYDGVFGNNNSIPYKTAETIFTLEVNDITRDVERISGVWNGKKGEDGLPGDPALPANTSENIRIYLANNSLTIPSTPLKGDFPSGWQEREPNANSTYAYIWTSTGNKITTYTSWTDEAKTQAISTVTYDAWTTPELWAAYGADNIDNKTYATFIKLMNNQPNSGGLLYDDNGKLWINANFIQSNYILVKDDNNNTIFSAASGNANSVIMGGFTVKGNSLYTNDKTSYNSAIDGVYIGNDGIGLGDNTNRSSSDPYSSFYVTNDGTLYSVKGSIGRWDISRQGLKDGLKVGMLTDGRGVHTSSLVNSSNVEPEYGFVRFYAGAKGTTSDNYALGKNGVRTIYTDIANFYVTDTGYLYTNVGNIAGLNIGQLGNNKVPAIYALGKDTSNPTAEQIDNLKFLLAADGIMPDDYNGSGNDYSYHFIAGDFAVTNTGILCSRIWFTQNDSNYIIPLADKGYELKGTWYYQNSPLTTSDINKKNSIVSLPEEYSLLFDNLNPVRYKYNDGTSDRYHTGFIAQDVLNAINAANLSTQDFAGYAEVVEDNNTACYLRYEEFIALNTAQIQALKARVAQLEEEIQLLKT